MKPARSQTLRAMRSLWRSCLTVCVSFSLAARSASILEAHSSASSLNHPCTFTEYAAVACTTNNSTFQHTVSQTCNANTAGLVSVENEHSTEYCSSNIRPMLCIPTDPHASFCHSLNVRNKNRKPPRVTDAVEDTAQERERDSKEAYSCLHPPA